MNCDVVSELFAAYLDNELTPEERSRVEAHLSGCSRCGEELKVLGNTQNNLRLALKSTVETIEPSPQAWDVVRELIESSGSFWARLSDFLNSPGMRMAVPVAVLVILAVGLILKASNFSVPALSPAPSPASNTTPSRGTTPPGATLPLPSTATPTAPTVPATPPAQTAPAPAT